MYRVSSMLLAIIAVSLFVSCGARDKSSRVAKTTSDSKKDVDTAPDGPSRHTAKQIKFKFTPATGHSTDFFPTDTGTTWTYDVEIIGDQFPLRYEAIAWPKEEGNLMYVERGIILKDSYFDELKKVDEEGAEEKAKPSKKYTLQLSVKGPAKQQGRFMAYPNGVELAIQKDEFGIFEEVRAFIT